MTQDKDDTIGIQIPTQEGETTEVVVPQVLPEEALTKEADDGIEWGEDEDDDFFAGLVDNAINDRLYGGEEVVEIPYIEHDAQKTLAHLLELGVRPNPRSQFSHSNPLLKILGNYLVRETSASNYQSLISNGHSNNMQDIASVVLSGEALSGMRFGTSVGSGTFSEYMNFVGEKFGKQLKRMLSIEIDEDKLVDVNNGNGDATKGDALEVEAVEGKNVVVGDFNNVKFPYQDIFFQGFEAEALIAAQAVLPLLKGYEDRLNNVKNANELAKIVFLAETQRYISQNGNGTKAKDGIEAGTEEKAKTTTLTETADLIQSQIMNPKADLDDIMLRTVFSFALQSDEELAKLNVDEALERYNKVLRSRFGYSQHLIEELAGVKDVDISLKGIVAEMSAKLEAEKGLFIISNEFRDESSYEEFKESLLRLEVGLYKKIETKEGESRYAYRHKFARTVNAERGTKYSNGTPVSRVPIGTWGKLDSDGDFVPKGSGSYFGLTMDELEIFENVHFASGKIKRGEKVKVVKNLGRKGGHGQDEYYYSGNISRVPLGSVGTIIKTEDDKTKIYIDFSGNGWYCHPDELEMPLKKKEKRKIEEEKAELTTTLTKIVEESEKEYREAKEKINELVTTGVETLKAMGVDEGVIRTFFDLYLGNEQDHMGKYIRSGILSERDAFEEIRIMQSQLSYNGVADQLVESIKEELGIYISGYEQGSITTNSEFQRLKEDLVEKVVNGYKTPDKKRKKKAKVAKKGFKKGQLIMLMQAAQSVPKGAIGTYGKDCGSSIHANFPGYHNDKCFRDNMPDFMALEPAFEIPEMPHIELKKDARVTIKRNSEYETDTKPGVIGTILADYRDNTEERYTKVKFDNGYQNDYRRKDLELVNPLETLEGKKLEVYKVKFAEYEALQTRIEQQLAPLIAKAEEAHATVYQKIDDLTSRTIDAFRSMGIDDARIEELFAERVSNPNYIHQRGLM